MEVRCLKVLHGIIEHGSDYTTVHVLRQRHMGPRPLSRALASIICSRFGLSNSVDLEVPSREPEREPPSSE